MEETLQYCQMNAGTMLPDGYLAEIKLKMYAHFYDKSVPLEQF